MKELFEIRDIDQGVEIGQISDNKIVLEFTRYSLEVDRNQEFVRVTDKLGIKSPNGHTNLVGYRDKIPDLLFEVYIEGWVDGRGPYERAYEYMNDYSATAIQAFEREYDLMYEPLGNLGTDGHLVVHRSKHEDVLWVQCPTDMTGLYPRDVYVEYTDTALWVLKTATNNRPLVERLSQYGITHAYDTYGYFCKTLITVRVITFNDYRTHNFMKQLTNGEER